jgi:hypothetical protein
MSNQFPVSLSTSYINHIRSKLEGQRVLLLLDTSATSSVLAAAVGVGGSGGGKVVEV